MCSCLSHVQPYVTPRTVAHQAPLSTGLTRKDQTVVKNELCLPGLQYLTEKPSEKSTTHSPHKRESNTGFSQLEGGQTAEGLSALFCYTDAVLGNPNLCVKQTRGLGERVLNQSHPREIAGTPTSPLFHTAGSFQAGNREASPASWVWPDPQETSLLIRLPLS